MAVLNAAAWPAPERALELEDIQGNVVRGYNLDHVAHVFFTIDDAPAFRRFLGALLDSSALPITSGRVWRQKPDAATNLGISYAGLVKLGEDPHGALKARFGAFSDGMPARAADLGDVHADYGTWADRHVWISLYGKSPDILRERERLLRDLAGGALRFSRSLWGSARRDREGQRLEPFGFRDGISNPVLRGDPLLEAGEMPGNGQFDGASQTWKPIAPGEFLLGYPDEQRRPTLGDDLGALTDLLDNGTFAVFRDLEQNVKAFKDAIHAYAAQFGVSPDFIAEKMVGRTRDGKSLAAPGADNAFSYDKDRYGSQCPFGAHARRANPRITGERRIIRRGTPYGNGKDGGAEGIYFVAFNASIESQFEFLQRTWLDGPAGKIRGSGDPLVSQKPVNMVIEGDRHLGHAPLLLRDIPAFVKCRGGQYYFVPGLRALRNLTRLQ